MLQQVDVDVSQRAIQFHNITKNTGTQVPGSFPSQHAS